MGGPSESLPVNGKVCRREHFGCGRFGVAWSGSGFLAKKQLAELTSLKANVSGSEACVEGGPPSMCLLNSSLPQGHQHLREPYSKGVPE